MVVELYGSEILKKRSVDVTEFNSDLTKLIDKMYKTMQKKKGVGLAAPQVGINMRMFITDCPEDKFRVFINPEIIQTSIEEIDSEEGCLSVPNVWAKVKRPESLTIQAQNEKGKFFKLSADKLLARAILHENDHLNGVLFVDHLNEVEKLKILKSLEKIEKTRK